MRPKYLAPAAVEPRIIFNISMCGESSEKIAKKTGYTQVQLKQYATEYVPKAAFIARVLLAYPALSFNDLFYIVLDSDRDEVKFLASKRMVPIPRNYEEAVNQGLKLEQSPYEDEHELRINIYEDDKPVCGFGPNGEFYKYGKDYRHSAVAQYIAAQRGETEEEDDDE